MRIFAFGLAIALSGCSIVRSVPVIRKSYDQISFGFFLAAILLVMLVGSILSGWIFVLTAAAVNIAFIGCSILASVVTAVGIRRIAPRTINQCLLVFFLIATIHMTLQLLVPSGPSWFHDVFNLTYPFSGLIELPILLGLMMTGWASVRKDNSASNILGILAGMMLLLINPAEYAYLALAAG